MLAMAFRNCLCRLCQSSVPSAHAVCLFGAIATRQSLPSRISDLLDVTIAEDDDYPEHICEKCKRRLERLEKAAEDLENFRSQANSSYSKLRTCRRGELKRTKESSGSVGISPDTAKNRPPSKRRLTQRRLDFTQSKKHKKKIIVLSYDMLFYTGPLQSPVVEPQLPQLKLSSLLSSAVPPVCLTVAEPLPLHACTKGKRNTVAFKTAVS